MERNIFDIFLLFLLRKEVRNSIIHVVLLKTSNRSFAFSRETE